MGLGAGTQVQAWEEVRKTGTEDNEALKDDSSCWCLTWSFRSFNRKVDTSSVTNPDSGKSSGNKWKDSGKENCKGPLSEKSFDSSGADASCIPKREEDLILSSHLRKFGFNDLKYATRNFRPDSFLGEGGFGCVFKGWIDVHGTAPMKPGTGLTVAVKTLNQSGLQGHKEWLAELNFLGQLQHSNLVKLVGYCIEDDHRLLVYEFMQRGSLENHLFRRGASPLPWRTRMKIALGAAKGLAFLHSGKRPVIYRDFKTSNILLDAEYNAKLSDFGLAKDGPEGDKSHVSTRVMGTYGYAAPEYVMTGHLTSKSDVYGFGVVLLEMLTGRRAVDKGRPSGEHNLVEWARPFLTDKKRVFKIVDPRLEGQFSVRGTQKSANLAHHCLSRDPKARPLMTEVVEMLGGLQNMKDMASSDYHFQPVNTHQGRRPLPPRHGNNNLGQVARHGPIRSHYEQSSRQVGGIVR